MISKPQKLIYSPPFDRHLPPTLSACLSVCLSMPPQNFLRCQNNKNNYNLVCETLQFLDCICGSTTGGLGLLGLYINEKNVALINQTLESLTEYCQGPCHENQVHGRTEKSLEPDRQPTRGHSVFLLLASCRIASPPTNPMESTLSSRSS